MEDFKLKEFVNPELGIIPFSNDLPNSSTPSSFDGLLGANGNDGDKKNEAPGPIIDFTW